jgi:hypothetical protein
LPLNRLMIKPRTRLDPPVNVNPSVPVPAPAPSSSMTGTPATAPGWVVPSIVVGTLTLGNGAKSAIVWIPVPGRLNVISAGFAAVAPDVFASMIACRSDPVPESAVVVTGIGARSCRPSNASSERHRNALAERLPSRRDRGRFIDMAFTPSGGLFGKLPVSPEWRIQKLELGNSGGLG